MRNSCEELSAQRNVLAAALAAHCQLLAAPVPELPQSLPLAGDITSSFSLFDRNENWMKMRVARRSGALQGGSIGDVHRYKIRMGAEFSSKKQGKRAIKSTRKTTEIGIKPKNKM